MSQQTRFAIDRTTTLSIDGSTQHVRTCAEREGLPPLLVVQAGPGFPLLHEAAKFQRLLHLERDFLVSYWDQRGCGAASSLDARSVSMTQQVEDLRRVVRWLHTETRQPVTVLGVSLGATIALQAAEHEVACLRAIVGISADSHTAMSDASACDFLQRQSAGNRRVSKAIQKLGDPPYLETARFQRRARLLADLGSIEYGRRFGALMREMLAGMWRVYGVYGTVKALRNMTVVQGAMLAGVASLDLLANTPRVGIPVHYVFGDKDALTPAVLVKELPARVAAPGSTVTVMPDAGHMVHFDRPEAVRSILVGAIRDDVNTRLMVGR